MQPFSPVELLQTDRWGTDLVRTGHDDYASGKFHSALQRFTRAVWRLSIKSQFAPQLLDVAVAYYAKVLTLKRLNLPYQSDLANMLRYCHRAWKIEKRAFDKTGKRQILNFTRTLLNGIEGRMVYTMEPEFTCDDNPWYLQEGVQLF